MMPLVAKISIQAKEFTEKEILNILKPTLKLMDGLLNY
jgi:hypothetical protein